MGVWGWGYREMKERQEEGGGGKREGGGGEGKGGGREVKGERPMGRLCKDQY